METGRYMNTLAIIQARCSSSRLPGKVLLPLAGEPLLYRLVERVRQTRLVDHVVVATSEEPSDEPLAEMCRQKGIACFRGPLDDVLERFYLAASGYSPEAVMRITGDCPLFDPDLADEMIARYREDDYDYASNDIVSTYPDGLDLEIIRFSALRQAWEKAVLPSEREHVTSYVWNRPEDFRILDILSHEDLSSLRLTVDEPRDYEVVSRIFNRLYPGNDRFRLDDILRLLREDPQIMDINRGIVRNEGYALSRQKDNR